MREKLNMFKEHSESKENRDKEYDSNERERIQIIQDEYLAKIIQNEEFLCELKQNKDFMQTLDSGKFIFTIFKGAIQNQYLL